MSDTEDAPQEAGEITLKGVGDSTWHINDLAGWTKALGQQAGNLLHEALRQAAFMICADVLAQDQAKAPLLLKERLRDGTARIVSPREHDVAAMLAMEPNDRHTWFEFMSMTAYWGALESNEFAVLQRNGAGDPIALIPVQTARVMDTINQEARKVFYRVTAGTEAEYVLLGTHSVDVPERDMLHVRHRMLDGMDGYSTMRAAKETIETGKALEGYVREMFADGGEMRVIFTSEAEQPLSEISFQRLKSQLAERVVKFRREKAPILLEQGITPKQVSATPADAELSKQLDAHIAAVCRWFRMPPHKAMHMNAVKYENLFAMDRSYVHDVILPRVVAKEQRLSRLLLTRNERARYFIEIDRQALVLTDQKDLTDRIKAMVERGLISVNEGRVRLGENPREGGDVYMIPANMRVVDGKNQPVLEASGQGGGLSQDPGRPEGKTLPTQH